MNLPHILLSARDIDYQHQGLREIKVTFPFVMEAFGQGCWQGRNSRSTLPYLAAEGDTEVLTRALSFPNYSVSYSFAPIWPLHIDGWGRITL